MGGIGSGKSYWKQRPRRSVRLFTRDLDRICISEFLQKNAKNPGVFIWDKQISLCVNEDVIFLSSIEDQTLDTRMIKIEKKPCHYGGFRFFALCPCCSKRVRDLYFYKTAFACRHCFRMTYYSRHTTLSTRLILKKLRIKRKINGDKFNKPKWMRHKTFSKLRNEYFDLEEKAEIANFYSLRNIQAVNKLFSKYGCAFAAADVLELQHLDILSKS